MIDVNITDIFIYSRWNSYYDSLVKVDSFSTKSRDNLAAIFDHFKLKKLTALVEEFLKEYIKIMKPITEVLDVFQNEENMSVGCVLPVLTLLKEKITEFQEDRTIIHCTPLVSCLLDGINTRFQSFFTDSNLRLASISDPHFKFSWMTEEQKVKDIKLLKNEVKRRVSNL